ncbi:MAG: PxKF domain-containing protein, partial [Anaerolineales bacterium]
TYGTPTATPYSSTPTPQTSSLRIAESIELTDLLYRVRDELLNTTTEGQRLSDLYYTYIPNIVQVLIAHPELSDSSFETMNLFAPSLQALLDGNGDSVVITIEQVQGLQSFLYALVQYGDEDLQSVILAELEKHPLENLVGLTMNGAWVQINGYEFEWLQPLGNANPYTTKQGNTIPVKFSLTDFENNFIEDESVYLQITDSNGNVVIGPVQVSNTPNTGIKIQGNQYHYNLKTKDLPIGSYTLEVFYNNGTQSEIKTITLTKK